MADPASRRALLGVPSDVFATWHDPHAEVRGRALAADPARAPRAASPPVFSPFEPLTPRHPRPAGPRVREPGRGLRPGRARRARAARAHPRARSRVRVRPLPASSAIQIHRATDIVALQTVFRAHSEACAARLVVSRIHVYYPPTYRLARDSRRSSNEPSCSYDGSRTVRDAISFRTLSKTQVDDAEDVPFLTLRVRDFARARVFPPRKH
jgi:hypothetical protein